MIFCKDVLFIHVPKTGGMSLTHFFVDTLPRPVYYSHPEVDKRIKDPGVIQIPGIRHESLPEAAEIVQKYGFKFSDFKLILAAVRNPYEMEVSRFAYLQKGHPWDRGRNQDLALNYDFEVFARLSADHGGPKRPIQSYFQVDGKVPPTLRVLRSENLDADVREALALVGIQATTPLLRDNVSDHQETWDYYTRGAEEAVYQRYKWVFDQGYYPRIDATTFKFAHRPIEFLPTMPLSGPVRQLGMPVGLWHDRWTSPSMKFRVRARERVRGLSIKGLFPRPFTQPITLTLSINGACSEAKFSGDRPFSWQLPCEIAGGDDMDVELKASHSFCPRELGVSDDGRKLSFLLENISFTADEPAAVVKT